MGLQARLLYRIKVNTRSSEPKVCCIIHQSGNKMSLLVEISQASQYGLLVKTVDPDLNNLVIHKPLIYRWRL